MEQFLGGLQVLLQWQNFLIIPVGLAIGIIVGAIPGLTSDLGLILCIPLTYGMDPTMAILMLLAIYCGGTYGGSITAILINTPGTSANAATLFDGYPMTQRGQAFKALQMALYASTIGGLISAFALLFLAPQIAKITLLFGPAEYFALAVFGLSVIAGVSNNSIFKGLIGACIGLFMATIGMDNISGTARFTFGSNRLMSGIDLIIALIGLFAISEIMMKSQYDPRTDHKTISSSAITRDKITKDEYRRCRKPIGIGSLIGVIIGATPGTGGGLAAFISYNQVKQSSSHPETFGHGEIEGVARLRVRQQWRLRRNDDPHADAGGPRGRRHRYLDGCIHDPRHDPRPHAVRRAGQYSICHYAGPDRGQCVYVYSGQWLYPFLRAYHPYSLRDFGGYCIDLLHCGCVFHQ